MVHTRQGVLMRSIVILGAGTAGTMMANRLCHSLRHEIETHDISITVVDQNRGACVQ